jgi:hypothetical protein
MKWMVMMDQAIVGLNVMFNTILWPYISTTYREWPSKDDYRLGWVLLGALHSSE